MGNWTPDLFLTKEVLYHWATTADVPLLNAAVLSGRRGSNPRPIAWKAIALPTELLPQLKWKVQNRKWKVNANFLFLNFRFSTFDFLFPLWWAGEDSNLWSRKTADLQSAPFGRSGTCPYGLHEAAKSYITLLRCPQNLMLQLSQRRDSNPRPADYKSAALPAELLWLIFSSG